MNDALLAKIEACPCLPSLPTVAVDVLNLIKSPDIEMRRLAEVIEKDPALVARLLRTVNSSYYGRSQKIATVNQALVTLGMHSVKTLVLGFSLVETLRDCAAAGFDHRRYWRHSFHTACAARNLARATRISEADELFVGGLLSGIGMLVMDATLGRRYGDVCRKVPSHVDQASMEMDAFGTHHGEVGGFMAQKWKLPAELAGPIAWHVEPYKAPDEQTSRLARLIFVAERCADVFVDPEPAPAISDVRQYLVELQGEATEGWADSLLSTIGQSTSEAAAAFEFNIGPEIRYEKILRDANEALVELTLATRHEADSMQKKAHQLELAFQARERAMQALRERATTDSLTGLANRAEFDRFLAEELANAAEAERPLALVMIDLDSFKQLNDTHGHPAGDAVLRHVGLLLRSAVTNEDLAARYGGEELALVLPNVNRASAGALAEHLRRTLAGHPIDVGGAKVVVTASFGVVAYEPQSLMDQPELLVRAADRALYHAKQSGRNRVKLFSLSYGSSRAA